MEILLSVEGRNKRLKLAGKTFSDLQTAFKAMCAADPVLRLRLDTHYATFKTFCPIWEMDVELEQDEALATGQIVKVFFHSYAPPVSNFSYFR